MRLILPLVACSLASVACAADRSLRFTMDQAFLTPPDLMATIGDSHGDIAVSPAGEIYVSVEGGERKGIQVYDAEGRYLRNVPNAPDDLHGFIIAMSPQGAPSIYGASLRGEQIVQLTLDGKIVLTIPGASIPDEYKTRKDNELKLSLTGVAVAPSGDIYAVDGYGRDYIHRFDKTGAYKGTFGGKGEPWSFNNCHKIAIDPRFEPVRLICTDRFSDRLLHMDLDGRPLGVIASGLLRPSAVAVFHDELAVAEIAGGVTILGLQGQIITSIGANDRADEVMTNQIPPARWRAGLFYAPHGITYDASGNLLVTEWNKWGRVVRVKRVK